MPRANSPETGATTGVVARARRRLPAIGLAYLLLGLGVAAFVRLVLVRQHETALIGQTQEQLGAAAAQRRDALERWLGAALTDASVVASYPTLRFLVEDRRGAPLPFPAEEGPVAHLNALLGEFVASKGYAAAAVMAEDGGLVASGGKLPLDVPLAEIARGVRDTGKPAIDLHGDSGSRPVVTFAVPAGRTGESSRPLTVVLMADADTALWPLLLRQPVSARSAETLLVRKEGDRLRFLLPLRMAGGIAVGVTVPYDTPRLVGRAALDSQAGFGRFVDHRGHEVLAATRRLATLPWGLVVAVDLDEALAPAERETRLEALALLALYLTLGALGYVAARRERLRLEGIFERREAELGAALRQLQAAVFFVSPSGRILEATGAAPRLYGIAEVELRTMGLVELSPPEARQEFQAELKRGLEAGAHDFDALQRARDGRTFPAEVSVRAVRFAGEACLLCLVRDLTERRGIEARLQLLNRILRTQSAVHRAVIHEIDPQRLLNEACQIAVGEGGFRMAWIGRAERDTGRVTPVASAGLVEGYLDEIQVRFDESAEGLGPVGRAIREERPAVVRDLLLDRDFAPWRKAASDRGYRAIVAAPIERGQEIWGALALYSGTPGAFAPEIRTAVQELAQSLGFGLEAIEERRRRGAAEETLRRTSEYLETLVQSAPLAIYTLDPDGRVGEVWNPAAERLFGWSREEAVGRPLPIVGPEAEADFRERLEQVLAGEAFEDAVLERRRRDGSAIAIRVAAAPLRDTTGNISGILAVAADVTARRRAEAELAKLSLAVEQAPVAVYITDTEGRLEYVNPRFTQLTGYAAADVLGRDVSLLRTERTPNERIAELWRTIRAGGTWTGEVCNRTRDGSEFWQSLSVSPVRDESGGMTHFVAVAEDVSERRRAEQALRETREQLLQSQKVEAIGRLAGGVAHDFNNLLGVITGYAELLLRSLPDGKERERVQRVMGAAERGASLTRQLLAYSRRQVLSLRVVDLNSVVQDAEKLLRRLIGEDVELRLRLPPQLQPVRVDPDQMGQVLLNLAVNARDAMPRGGVVTLETRDVELDAAYAAQHEPVVPGRYVMLAVSDTGVGMDAAVRERIFEPFFTTKPPGVGTGLGLATVYGIVKQSGGYIWAYSEPGLGTTFRVYLPAVDAPAEALTAPGPSEPRPSGHETVLLVEDQEALREVIAENLHLLGYTVLEAEDADQAERVARAHAERLDLLLTDVVMPGTSGRELAERLHASHPDLRVLFMSGYTSDVAARHGVVEGGVRLLEKPFTTDVLARRVREALDAHQPRRG